MTRKSTDFHCYKARTHIRLTFSDVESWISPEQHFHHTISLALLDCCKQKRNSYIDLNACEFIYTKFIYWMSLQWHDKSIHLNDNFTIQCICLKMRRKKKKRETNKKMAPTTKRMKCEWMLTNGEWMHTKICMFDAYHKQVQKPSSESPTLSN